MTTSAEHTPLAVDAMARRLTAPFARGADRLSLRLDPGATPDAMTVGAYDFTEYFARYGRDPEISYVLAIREPIGAVDEVRIDLTDPLAGASSVTVRLSDAEPGDSFHLALPSTAGPQTRLVALHTSGSAIAAPTQPRHWELTALLGTLARVLWVIGAERDRLSHVRQQVRSQRQLAAARGFALDLMGLDLHIPRFPPTPYSVDDSTIALYHFDDTPGSTPAVADAAAAFPGRTPHHGALSGPVTLGSGGRYESAAAFAAGAAVTVPSHPDFDIPAAGAFTVDCFVRPDPATTSGTLAARWSGGSGWRLEVGEVGLGVPGGLRATVSDGAATVTVAAATRLPTDRFSHIAMVLERNAANPTAGTLSILADGVRVGSVSTTGLGAIGSSADLVVGPSTTGFVGAVDELHLRSLASAGFHPVLGEDDEQYRRRLSLFRQWVLPTPRALQEVLNELVGEIDGVADPFVVEDADGPTQSGKHLMRIWPAELVARLAIAASGEIIATGADPWQSAEPFDGALLGRHHHPQLSYRPAPPDPTRSPILDPADPQLMQPAVASALDRLVGLLTAQGVPDTLEVLAGFDQAATDSRAAGRAVLLRHPALPAARLAALAHRAGFDYVEHRVPAAVYAASAPGRPLLLGPTGSGPDLQQQHLPEVPVGTPVSVTVGLSTATYDAPVLPPDATVTYWSIPTGAGRGVVDADVATPTAATLTPTAAGVLGLSADIRRGHRVVTTTAAVVVRPTALADGDSIAADGTPAVTVAAAGPAEAAFDPAYLRNHADPRVDYGADPNHHRMARRTGDLLTALAQRLEEQGIAGPLRVAAAYDPTAAPTDLASRGRLLVLEHASLSAGALAVAAHAAGFEYVERSGATVRAAAASGDLIELDGPNEVEVGSAVTLTAGPAPADISPTTRLGWSSGPVVDNGPGPPSAALLAPGDPSVTVEGTRPGIAWVRATLKDVQTVGPYAVTVRRRASLATAKISRANYYLVMNALNTLHPIGVEVRTEDIRAAVVELGTAPSGLAPEFTYPPFRLRRPVPVRRAGDDPRST